MGAVNHFQKRHLWHIVLILLVASFLRLDDLLWFGYQYDSADLSKPAIEFVQGNSIPTKGVLTSKGVYNPPAMAYIMSLPYSLSFDPTFAVMFIRFWNLLGVAMLYSLMYRYFSPSAALLGGLVYAFNPWGVLYSSILWNVTLHVPFVIGGYLLAGYGFLEGKKWGQALCIPVLMVAPQVHYSGVLLVPALLWLVWLGRKQISWRAIAVGIALVGVMLLPFIAGLTDDDIAAYEKLIQGEETTEDYPPNWSWLPAWRTVNLAMGLGLEIPLAGERHIPDLMDAVFRPDQLWWILGMLFGLGGLVIWRIRWQMAIFCLLWLAFPILGMVDANFVSAHYHYLIILLPCAILLVGVGAAYLMELLPRFGQVGFSILLVGIWLTQAVWWNEAQAYVGSHAVDGHGTPFEYLKPIREILAEYEDVIIVGGSTDSNTSVWGVLLPQVKCMREPLQLEGGLVILPPHPFAVFYPSEAQGNPVDPWTLATYIQNHGTMIDARQDETPNRVLVYEEAPNWDYVNLKAISPQRFDNGAELQGYALESGMIFLDWKLFPAENFDTNYQFFVHFIDESGEKIGQRDSSFLQGRFWCPDDRIISWIPAEIPAETVGLRVGMYEIMKDGGLRSALAEGANGIEISLN